MLHALLILVGLQYVGGWIAGAVGLPVPGTVIGLVLLWLGLSVHGARISNARAVPEALVRTVRGLHDHFGLLFVPAGAGVVAHLDQLAQHGVALLIVIIVSTALTIGATAVIAAGARTAPASAGVPAE
jgi:holin-like protein